jgi:hypothetical protein
MSPLSAPPQKIVAMAAAPSTVPNRAPSKDPRFIRYLQDLEALDDVNRYYFYEKHGREPSVEEAIAHYRQNGGPEAFMKAHPELG